MMKRWEVIYWRRLAVAFALGAALGLLAGCAGDDGEGFPHPTAPEACGELATALEANYARCDVDRGHELAWQLANGDVGGNCNGWQHVDVLALDACLAQLAGEECAPIDVLPVECQAVLE